MKKIYVCSPYRGNIEENIEYARKICRRICLNGDVPIATHLYFTQFLCDEIDAERELGIDFALKMLHECDEVWVCGKKISEGMKKEINEAVKHGIPAIRKLLL